MPLFTNFRSNKFLAVGVIIGSKLVQVGSKLVQKTYPKFLKMSASSNFISKKNITRVRHVITNDLADITSVKMEELLKKLSLSTSSYVIPMTGSRPLVENSKEAYEKHARGLEFFFNLIGAYDSLLILLKNPPFPFCPSMSPSDIKLYIQFKRLPKDTLLVHDGSAVKDVFGKEVMCQGSWNDPKNVEQLISAIGAIHQSRNQRGPYEEPCGDCLKLEEQGLGHQGCRFHYGRPAIWSRGNPKHSEILEYCVKQTAKEGATYQPDGDSPLTPWELLDIRTNLISSNELWDFELWLLILISCKMSLREDEVSELQDFHPENIQSLNYDLFVVSETGNVEGITLNIKGKTDKVIKTLTCWRDDVIPTLCPVRHLLVFLHMLNWQSGYFFPSHKVIQKVLSGEHDGNFISGSNIDYNTFQTRYKSICQKVVNRRGPWGTHTSKKTFYLLAVWGGGNDIDIIKSARHSIKNQESASKYKRDATFLLNLAQKNRLSLNAVVSPWQPIFCQDLQLGRRINASSHYQKDIKHLAREFVVSQLKINSNHPERCIKFVIDTACTHKSEAGLKEKINNLLQKTSPEISGELEVLIEKYAQANRYVPLELPKSSTESITSTAILLNLAQGDSDCIEGGNSLAHVIKAKRGGENNLDGRLSLKRLKNCQDKISALMGLYNEVPGDHRLLTEGARQFVVKQLRPILNCFANHHCSNLESFQGKWGDTFSISQFKEKCCKGGPSSCINQ
jgi:hypothetical protein